MLFLLVAYNLAGVPFVSNDSYYQEFFEYVLEFKFKITAEMSPELKVLTYFVIDDEIIPDSILLKTQRCLKNKVILIYFRQRIFLKFFEYYR